MRYKNFGVKAAIVVVSILCTVSAMALSGKWRGELSVGQTKLPLVFSFSEDASGGTVVTMDSPLQNAKGIPLEVNFISVDSVSVACRQIGAVYNARIVDETISGIFVQRGYRFPLVLYPERPIDERRPQTPRPPYPYMVKDTVFRSSDGTELAGTLTVPKCEKDVVCPVVVMVTGSGPQNRDEEIFEHRPFAVIADYLARNGIASLRYDDRGVASSKGEYAKATIDTFRIDAESALRFVKGMPEFGKAGILGHSEGGTLAILIAAEGEPDFIISLAGMATSSKETLMRQNMRVFDKFNIVGKERDASIRLIEILFDEIISQKRNGKFTPIDVDQLCAENSLVVPPVVLESVKRSNAARTAYFDSLVSLDPTEALKRITCPVLAINGTKDVQVVADVNLETFRQNVRNVDIRRMEGLNHLMQHADSGEVTEYNQITETISPEVLQIIADFITDLLTITK